LFSPTITLLFPSDSLLIPIETDSVSALFYEPITTDLSPLTIELFPIATTLFLLSAIFIELPIAAK
jgi:hypothetical protein